MMDLPTARGRMTRRATKLRKHIATLEATIKDKSLDVVEIRWLRDVCCTISSDRDTYNRLAEFVEDHEHDETQMGVDEKDMDKHRSAVQEGLRLCSLCHSMKNVYDATQALEENLVKLEAFYDDKPERNYNSNLKVLSQYLDAVIRTLGDSSMEKTHPLRQVASKVIDRVYLFQTTVATSESKVKPTMHPEGGVGGLKFGTVSPPSFSGNQKDYQTFWSEFKSIHLTDKLTGANKLGYLRQAQKDPELRRRISENIDNGDRYEDVIAKFQQHFDRPRQMHRVNVNQLLQLSQVKPTRSSILDCANTVQSAMNGLIRLGQWDAPSIVTSMVEELLPAQLKAKWSDNTITQKKVPPVTELIAERADQPQYMEKVSAPPSAVEKKTFSKQKASGLKSSVHVTSSQPSQAHPQQQKPQAQQPAARQGSYDKTKSVSFPTCRYSCPECSEAHYAFGCDNFKEKTTSQKKEFVAAHSLCFRCLKPGHSLQECRNRKNCRHCDGNHHVLLHSERRDSNTPASSGTVHAISTNSDSHSFDSCKLVMTCEAEVTGPMGKTLKVRAMLDYGAAVSSVSTRVAKLLNLKYLDATMDIETFNSKEGQVCKTANFTISSLLTKNWSHRVSAIIVDKIISRQPQQDASEIKKMAEAQGLDLADSQFHRPGRIDVLLGVDVLPHVQTREGSDSSITAVDTVFLENKNTSAVRKTVMPQCLFCCFYYMYT